MTCSNGEESPTPSFGSYNQPSRPAQGRRIAPLIATLLLAIPILSIAAQPAFATPISNGEDFAPAAAVGDPTASIFVTDETSQVTTYLGNNISNGVDWTANVESWVYANSTTNPYSSTDTVDNPIPPADRVDGAMTFVYQIHVTSPTGDVGQLDVANFGSNQTDIGYFDNNESPEEPEIFPSYIDRDLTGMTSTISFLFFPVDGQFQTVDPNQYSALLVVNTDATTYSSTNVELQDGANGSGPSYAIYGPAIIQTPEPTSMVLMVLGLTGLLAVARRRRGRGWGG